MNKLLSLLLGGCLYACQALAQQVPHFSQYMLNGVLLNPAHLTRMDFADVMVLHRQQWAGMAGAPVTQTINFNMPTPTQRASWGGSLMRSAIGITELIHLRAHYAYRIPFEGAILSFGLNGGLVSYQIDANALNLYDPISQDRVFSEMMRTKVVPDVGFGMSLRTERFRIGFSTPHLNQSALDFTSADALARNPEGIARLYRHYFLTAAANFSAGAHAEWVPSVLIKYVRGVPVQADLNLTLLYPNRFWAGISYRTGDAVSVLTGMYVQNKGRVRQRIMRIGYAFDLTASPLNAFTRGSHEILLSYSFRVKSAIKCAADKDGFDTFVTD